MGNRAIISLEDANGKPHPAEIYVHWNGGLESVLAFIKITWDHFDRTHDDVYTFHARLCQVIGNFFREGLSLYGYPYNPNVDLTCADNGRFHFRIDAHGYHLLNRDPSELEGAKDHKYWKPAPGTETIFDTINRNMPKARDFSIQKPETDAPSPLHQPSLFEPDLEMEQE